MGCGSHLHHVAVLVAVARGRLALIGWALVLHGESHRPSLSRTLIRDRETEGKAERRKRWRGMVVWMVTNFVLLGIISAIHLPKSAYVMWVNTFVPIGAVDLGHYEHCKAQVTDKPLDQEVQTFNTIAQTGRPGPDTPWSGFGDPRDSRRGARHDLLNGRVGGRPGGSGVQGDVAVSYRLSVRVRSAPARPACSAGQSAPSVAWRVVAVAASIC